VLMVTTTVWMVNRIHSNTTSTRPVVSLCLVLMVCTSSLQEGLINSPPTGNDANSGTSIAANGLFRSRGKTDSRLVIVSGVPDDGGIVARGASQGAAVTNFLLDVADDGTFWKSRDGEDVSDIESGFLAAIDKGASVKPFGSDEGFSTEFVPVGIAENDTSKGSTTSRIVNDLFYNASDISITLSKVQGSKRGRSLIVMGVGFEDGMRASLSSDYSTHIEGYEIVKEGKDGLE